MFLYWKKKKAKDSNDRRWGVWYTITPFCLSKFVFESSLQYDLSKLLTSSSILRPIRHVSFSSSVHLSRKERRNNLPRRASPFSSFREKNNPASIKSSTTKENTTFCFFFLKKKGTIGLVEDRLRRIRLSECMHGWTRVARACVYERHTEVSALLDKGPLVL